MPEPAPSPSLLRIVDANANRAGEALRVVEDFLRYALDDQHLCGLAKQMRHELDALCARFSARDLLAARETQADVGVELVGELESERDDALQVVLVNFKRLQQALRSLEEYSKLLDAESAAGFETLRYRSYTLQRAVHTTCHGRERLSTACLYVLADGQPSEDDFARHIAMLVEAGVDVVQLRDKSLDDRTLAGRARCLRQLTRETETLCIINDRPDIAAAVAADGVHLGQEELTVKDARLVVGSEPLVGVSTHSIAQARQAVLDGADYLGCGPTFDSSTKQFDQLAGPQLLQAVHDEIRLPAFAIGGIDLDNLDQVLASGIRRIALQGAIARNDDPQQLVRHIKQVLQAAGPAGLTIRSRR